MKIKSLFLVLLVGFIGFECQSTEKPNIIWLMSEDMSLDLECYGMKAVKTPTLNKMAEDGIMFTNAYCTNSICAPSRSAMMTGVHQLKINAQHMRSNRDIPLAEPYKPLTYWLRQAGYTCILGHHGVLYKGEKIDVNFKHQPLGEWDGVEKFGLFDKKSNFETEDQPFFAQIQLKVTHRGDWWTEIREKSAHPVNPDSVELPPYFADHPIIRLDWAKYLDQIEYMDNEVAMIFKELEDKGMAENTIVIFIGDNGRCNIRGKGYLQDPGLHIPLLVKWPKGIKAGQVRKDIVSTTDITATILDVAGAEMPDYLTGKSFLKNEFYRNEVYATRDLWDEIMDKSRAVTNDKWKYIRNDMPEVPYDAHHAYLEFFRPAVHVMRSLKTEGKLDKNQSIFFAPEKQKEELYDLANDPFELNNLATNPDYAAILDSLRSLTVSYDERFKSVSDVLHPVYPLSVDILNWVKTTKPELYKEMLGGKEIGYQRLAKEYKALKIKNAIQ